MLLVLELMGGMRVGEATSSGDDHGLAAPDCCLMKPSHWVRDDGLGETFEGHIRDSKTGPGRHIAFVGKSQGELALDAAAIVREYWRASGVAIQTKEEGGMQYETPDYYVIRVAAPYVLMEKMAAKAEDSACAEVARQAKAIAKYVKERGRAANLGEDERYVNVVGGRRDGEELREGMAWLAALGLAKYASVVPGPLIRSTLGYLVTHMPLAVSSTYTHLVEGIGEAYAEMKAEKIVDPELDLAGQVEPHWGNHSLRRHADAVAQRARQEGRLKATPKGLEEVTSNLIDVFFGWALKELRQKMQLHYAGLSRVARRALARVTMWM
jgi:hypothetical protein